MNDDQKTADTLLQVAVMEEELGNVAQKRNEFKDRLREV